MTVGLRTVLSLAALALVATLLAGALLAMGAVLAAPAWLHLAWLAPGLLLLDALAARGRRRAARAFGQEAAFARLVEGRARGLRALRALLGAAALLLLSVACARPQWGLGEEQLRRRGVDVLFCVDVSRSMLAEDVAPNRLTRARLAVSSLLERLHGDRVGLLAYAGEARVLCPLTLDHSAARLFLDTLDPELLQRPGTAIASALRLAGRLLGEREGRNGVVILLSDGEDHGGEAVEAAKELAAAGIVVHAIGFGGEGGTPIPLREQRGAGGRAIGFIKDAEGNAVMTHLDVATLSAIADATGGSFQRGTASEVGLAQLAQQIAGMEKQDLAARKTITRTDRAWWFLLPAFALLVVEAFLPDGARLRRRRERTTRLAAVEAAARRPRSAA